MEEGEFFNAIKKFEKSTCPRRGHGKKSTLAHCANGKKSTSRPTGLNVKKEFTHGVSNFSEVADFKKRLAELEKKLAKCGHRHSGEGDITIQRAMSSFEWNLGST